MVLLKRLAAEEKNLARQRETIRELQSIAAGIERCEKTIIGLRDQLVAINAQYQGPRDTRQDIGYLSGLLACAKKKLGWEKQLAGIQKRTPKVLKEMNALLNDPQAPPGEETRLEMLKALQQVQAAMERLQGLKPE